MKVAIHQSNFIPWFPFFYKMAMADLFIILCHVDFEKGGFQNRYYLNEKEKWVTKSVKHGLDPIIDKEYTDGTKLLTLNMNWINAIRKTLKIETLIDFDYPTELTKTERLIDIIKHYGGTTYITCPNAKKKYLDEELIKSSGIDIEYMHCPKDLQIHTFEAFDKFGIDGCIKRLPRREKCQKQLIS